jgi:rRNA maturation RNase YbeY
MAIHYFFEQTKNPKFISASWKKLLKATIEDEAHILRNINFIFCDDEFLYKINSEYLRHHTYTDIITFDNSEKPKDIEGDIYISLERTAENAQKYKVAHQQETARVMLHGILHLCGYKDKNPEEITLMRAKEEHYLQKYFQTEIGIK